MGLNVYDVGDAAPLTLTIDEADSTTVAVVDVTSPTGVETRLAAVPNATRDEWTAALPLTEPGVWVTVWTVTGFGAGVERHRLAARTSTRARSYATTADLAGYPGVDVPPGDADALLARATRLVDRIMRGARWTPAEGTDNLPADPTVAAGYRDATCALVAAWLEQGAGDYGTADDEDEADVDEFTAWVRETGATSVSFGSVNIGLGKSSSDTSSSGSVAYDEPAPAVDVLMSAGLFPPRIGVVW